MNPTDLSVCDREPIRIPGRIQSHGVLIAMDADLVVRQISENARMIGVDAASASGRPLSGLLSGADTAGVADAFRDPATADNPRRLRPLTLRVDGKERLFDVIAHRRADVRLLELEPAGDGADASFTHFLDIGKFLGELRTARTMTEQTDTAAREIRRITGFDRVLVYYFDADWNGVVVAEARNDRFSTLLDHRFPAADIPAQARELYRINRLRLIPNAEAETSALVPPLNPDDGAPLDLSFATLRSVSPIHIEYMRNMGTLASMSVSIIVNDRLWGLISCHNRTPRHVPFAARLTCDVIGQMLSLQIPALEHASEVGRRVEIKSIQARLLASMATEENFIDGLRRRSEDLLRLAAADGAAILFDQECVLVGRTPSEDVVRGIADWLSERSQKGVFDSARFPEEIGADPSLGQTANGVLSISISQLYRSYILWFRPEITATVRWAGDPTKMVPDLQGRIHPRKSFETWLETVKGQSRPWAAAELEAVNEFRSAVVNIVLRKAEELAQVNAELRRTNQELEAFSYSVSHDLRAPFRHIVGYANLLNEEEVDRLSDSGRRYVGTILESAEYAGTLVDNLLSLSRIGRTSLRLDPVDMDALVRQVQRDGMRDVDRPVKWRIHPLPRVHGDLVLLRVVLQNLIANALKFTRPQSNPEIEIGVVSREAEHMFYVRDNGVGFDMQYVDKLFGVFQRLHKIEEFEGTGIGLATVRRIINRHGGRVWAEGEPDKGAAFFFTLPKPLTEEPENHA